MEYPKRSVNGDAGEYLVAHQITRFLGWPCRLHDVDIGIDAETEILDEYGQSTGDVIKIQIKSRESLNPGESVSITVDESHVKYWKRFCLPVIVCCVDLNKSNIYWKQITATEAYNTAGVSKKVTFCTTHDLLSPDSKEALKRLATPEKSKKIEELFILLDNEASEIPQGHVMLVDFTAINDTRNQCDRIEVIIKEIEELICHFPWRFSTLSLRKVNYLRERIRSLRIDCGYYQATLTEGS